MSSFDWNKYNGGDYAPTWKPAEGESAEGDVANIDSRERQHGDHGGEYPVVTIKLANGESIAWHCSSFGAIRAAQAAGVQIGDHIRVTRLADDGMARRFEVRKATRRVVKPTDEFGDWS